MTAREIEKYKQELVDFWAAIKTANDAGYRYGVDVPGTRRESHIPYIGDYHPMHVMNLYYPEDFRADNGKLPAIIDIHWGGWMYGTVDDSERYLQYLASKGYAVMGMNYRLLPETDLGGIIRDIFASLSWLAEYGGARGFDLSRILLTGDSAGGHLALLTAYLMQSAALREIYGVADPGLALSAVCVCSTCTETDRLGGIADDEESERGRGTAAAYRELLLGPDGEAAPWNGHMSISETAGEGPLPPVLIIGSESDSLYAQTKLLEEIFRRHGQTYEELIWKREDGPHLQHVFNISHWEWRESILSNDRMLAFFDAAAARDRSAASAG